MSENLMPLSPAAAAFYGDVWSPARAGCLNFLRRLGCSEEEAKELFGETFEQVMQRVDPIKRGFLQPQMVSFLKKACYSRWVDAKRHRSALKMDPLTAADIFQDHDADDPVRRAEKKEEIQIIKEALLSLLPRERRIFQLRYIKGLSPDKIRRLTPGLTDRTYRKLIQRANKRVDTTCLRIESGQRCEELGTYALKEFIAGTAPVGQAEAIKAHLEHCRRCQQRCTRLRGIEPS